MTQLELDDIQSGVLRPRPTPYVATYIAFRIDNRQAGRELVRRASHVVTSAANPNSPLADTWVSVALTCKGLEALGVPQESLDSLSWEFRQGMAARAKDLGDVGESAPQNWEEPLGSSDLHVVLVPSRPTRDGSNPLSNAPARLTATCRASRQSGVRIVTRSLPRPSLSDIATASVIRRLKIVASREPIHRNGRSRQVSCTRLSR